MNKKTITRPRGRPAPREGVDRREDILNIAEKLFALKGFSATAIREIADEAEVNSAMVHYYFGSKQKLLEAVMDRVFEPLAEAIDSMQDQQQVDIQDFVKLFFSTISSHRYLPQLVVREIFLPGGKMQQQFLQHFAPRLGGRLPGMLKSEQQAGRLSNEFQPEHTALMILSLCIFPMIARPAAEKALNISYDEAGLKTISRHISQLLERGLKNES